ncbi:MAG: hypothetical protein M3Y24_01790 [Acidobacteriota bacterium]|nr:hypothetical protein [Acidobacteriota bacterium]
MEPLSDRELDDLLREWRAPSAPEALGRRVRNRDRGAWWKWLLTGSIRVPVPLTLAVAAIFIAMVFLAFIRSPGMSDGHRAIKPAGLQPVKRLEVQIIRSSYEGNN